MNDDSIGMAHPFQGDPLVAGLTSGTTLALLSSGVGSAAHPIAGGWFAAIMAVGAQPFLEFFHLLSQDIIVRPQCAKVSFVEVLQVLD
jgi:hypothetical protein